MLVIEDPCSKDNHRFLQKSGVHRASTAENLSVVNGEKVKTAFLANVTHELKTPLSIILGSSELILQTDLSDPQREYVQTLHDSANSLLRLVNQLLELTAIESGTVSLQNDFFNFPALIDNVSQFFSSRITPEITFETKVDRNLPESIRGSAERLSQILHNLIDNGLKFTRKGAVRLSTSLIERTDTTVTIRFEVSDTGIGMSAEDQHLLETPLTQLDDGFNRQHEGLGLGLTISRRLIQLMGGSLRIESKKDCGSTFSFDLCFETPKLKLPEYTVQERNSLNSRS